MAKLSAKSSSKKRKLTDSEEKQRPQETTKTSSSKKDKYHTKVEEDTESMAKLSPKSSKKKRKLTDSEQKQMPQKNKKTGSSKKDKKQTKVEEVKSLELTEPNQNLEKELPWRNLQVVLSLQSKEIDIQEKVNIAFNFLKTRAEEGANEDFQTVKTPKLIVFLSDWVQSLLISTEKKDKVAGEGNRDGVFQACLDFRCWEILKFCLEESSKLHVSLNLSRNLLRAISYISKDVLASLNGRSMCSGESSFTGEGFEVYRLVLDCISMMFSSQKSLLNENLDLWISSIRAVLDLVDKVHADNLEHGDLGSFVHKFACLVLEPFAKFLKAHPTRKNGFRDFVDKLLEPLLHMLGILHRRVDDSIPDQIINMQKLVEEVLSHGLFQPAHIDGFLGLRSTDKYFESEDTTSRDTKIVLQSYHRHLFDKFESIIAAKEISALSGIGELIHLLADRVTKQKKTSILTQGGNVMAKSGGPKHMDGLAGQLSKKSSKDSYSSNNLNPETRKSLFDFFVQIMEPLLIEMNACLQTELEPGLLLSNVYCTLKSTNSLLFNLMHEKVYVKTEDISEGACANFLKEVYSTILSVGSSLLLLHKDSLDDKAKDLFILSANEIHCALGYLLEIEYEVMGSDLISLWLMVVSYLAAGLSFVGVPHLCSLNSQIINFGCKLVHLYSELRQVNTAIFALCKAVRLIVSHDNYDGETAIAFTYKTSIPYETIAKSVGKLLSSQKFKIAIHNAIKSIPEGQSSGCIRQLTLDLSESIEWLKTCSVSDGKGIDQPNKSSIMPSFGLQSELLGRGLSEIYTVILDSLTATTGNSNLLGLSLSDLMNVIRPCISNLVVLQPDCVKEFLFSVTGRTHDSIMAENENQKYLVSSHWIVVFFFRLFMSCRSFFRQVNSLMTPDVSKKMSDVMGDSITTCSGKDWMEKKDWSVKGYFSWAVQLSASLFEIINSVSDFYFKEKIVDCGALVYLLHEMALQRLVDLNRNKRSFEYLLQSNDNMAELQLIDESGLLKCGKRSKKFKRRISSLKQEAEDLTEFMMKHLSLVDADPLSTSTNYQSAAQGLTNSDKWDFSVAAINEKSLHTALWWALCQNIDIWCNHATNKKLKKFLSLLISTSIPRLSSSPIHCGKQSNGKTDQKKELTIHQISSELLRDSIFYEHKFVGRNISSRFCHVLEKSALDLFNGFSEVSIDLSSSPNWPEVLSTLDKLSPALSGKEEAASDSSHKRSTKNLKDKETLQVVSMNAAACQNLLNLLCWMPKGYLNTKSFQLYATHILNLERLAVGCLLRCEGMLSSRDQFELLRLIVSCRRTLKYMIMVSGEEKTGAILSSLLPDKTDCSLLVLWLFKSLHLVAGFHGALLEDHANEARDLRFSLLDHTSYVFLAVSKYEFIIEHHRFISSEKSSKEQSSSGVEPEESIMIQPDQHMDFSRSQEDFGNVLIVAEGLKEQAEHLLISLKSTLCNRKIAAGVEDVNLNKLSSVLSCFSGFLWGLAAAVNHADEKKNAGKTKLRWKSEPVGKLNQCIKVFVDFINLFVQLLFVESDSGLGSLINAKSFQKFKYTTDSCGQLDQELGAVVTCSTSSDVNDLPRNSNVLKSKPEDRKSTVSVLSEVNLDELQCSSNVMQGLLKGDHPETVYSLRLLLIASSAILKLNLLVNTIPLPSNLVHFFVGISQAILSGLADMSEVPQPFSFVWLDGVLKYLEELGSHFPLADPTLTSKLYTKLIEMHIRAIGKCNSLQGKGATLASHEIESSTKMLQEAIGFSEPSLSHGPYCLDEFKTRLRMSFIVLIEKSSELHLQSAIQAIGRALVGIWEDRTSIYKISTGSTDGGRVSSTVAAGIDCLDLVLEYVPGRKRLNVVKRHIQSLTAALFNILVHLRNPSIFYVKPVQNEGHADPDPGSAILMCIEVLTRIAGKHALFRMESWHVGQSLGIPAALFQQLCQLRQSGAPSTFSTPLLDNQHPVLTMSNCVVDRRFLINLYSACCRLLYTVLKHHKSEAERSLAILEQSVSVLLYSLEAVDIDSGLRKGLFSWEIQEGIKCACFLRRIYEELRQQKDVFGRHCFKFLSTYIWVYSRYGPLKIGIIREIDEALKPGIYALIDACSADDLQYLHTVFGEGPCRNTLASLQHDYKLNFQYGGKV